MVSEVRAAQSNAPEHSAETLVAGHTISLTAPALKRALDDVRQQAPATTTAARVISVIPVPAQITTTEQAYQLTHFRILASGG